MIDHISIPVLDLDRAGSFYDNVLHTLQYARIAETEGAIGYGRSGDLSPGFWLLRRADHGFAQPGFGLHLSFSAHSHAAVQEFFDVALANGATDAGAPGARPHYSNHFYGAFVLDLDGFKVEAVCRGIAAG